jgi:large subunit ribosomal protein L25
MNKFELVAEHRADVGKGASRRLRRDGRLPGIVYGSHGETRAITLDANTIKHQLENEAFYSHILTLKLDGKDEKVVLKDLQRHPYKPLALHVDLQRVDEKEAINMRVPLHFINEEKCQGVRQQGGVVSHIITEVEISCLPQHLPEYIEVDVLELGLGDSLHLSDIKLPEGVSIYALAHGGDDQPVVAVQAPRVAAEDLETPEEEEEETPEVPATAQSKEEPED